MKKVRIEDVPVPETSSPADVIRPLSPALDVDGVALNYSELAPTESFGFEYHRHLDQEEVFYVLHGTATFETESGDVEVSAGELVRFAPGEFQLGRNRSDERVVALAIGAPRDSTDVEYLRDCPVCGDRTIQTPAVRDDERAVVIRCAECDTEVDSLSF
jgi:uncharacterized cupin superfamily protein